jgi:mannose-6-phosphate isomerase-like protein (cupin superfamily)
MKFSLVPAKGLSKCLFAEGMDPGRLHLHVSEIAPGASAHPPHVHGGTEAFYVLEGNATIEVEGELHNLGPNEAIVLDATREHGLTNTGSASMRYLVIIAR